MRNLASGWRSCRRCSRSPPASSRIRTRPPPTIWPRPRRTCCRRRPSPRYPVNADLDGKVIFLGMDVDPVPAEAGKDLKLTQYFKVVTPAGRRLEDRSPTSRGRTSRAYINADHVPIDGKYPGRVLEGGRHHPRRAHRQAPRQLAVPGGRGLRRPLARADPDAGQVGPPRHRGARAGGVASRCARDDRRAAQAVPGAPGDQAAQARRQARRRGLDGGPVDRALRQHA